MTMLSLLPYFIAHPQLMPKILNVLEHVFKMCNFPKLNAFLKTVHTDTEVINILGLALSVFVIAFI